ncbi:MAG TPA: hypothetical protein PKA37_04465, partial [Planctomycetota bacterium]|nr:hypothetical protein [Planctomycetota bacterium]
MTTLRRVTAASTCLIGTALSLILLHPAMTLPEAGAGLVLWAVFRHDLVARWRAPSTLVLTIALTSLALLLVHWLVPWEFNLPPLTFLFALLGGHLLS